MSLDTPSLIRALPLLDHRHRLRQNAFQGEPAITRFDELFTPRHRSSEGLAAPTGSGLQNGFPDYHPAHA